MQGEGTGAEEILETHWPVSSSRRGKCQVQWKKDTCQHLTWRATEEDGQSQSLASTCSEMGEKNMCTYVHVCNTHTHSLPHPGPCLYQLLALTASSKSPCLFQFFATRCLFAGVIPSCPLRRAHMSTHTHIFTHTPFLGSHHLACPVSLLTCFRFAVVLQNAGFWEQGFSLYFPPTCCFLVPGILHGNESFLINIQWINQVEMPLFKFFSFPS